MEGKSQLWLRLLGSFTAQPLSGSDRISGSPIWSPDCGSIAFYADDKLQKMDLSNGTLQTLCNIGSVGYKGFGGTWNRADAILFCRGGIIYRVPATGGEPVPVPGVDKPRQGVLYRWPSFLPDGRHFLYLVTTEQQEESEVYLASLDGKETERLLAADSNAIYAASAAGAGYLLFVRQGALLSQPFDVSNLMLAAEPFRVADQVQVNGNSRGQFSVSDNGTLIYDLRGNIGNEQLAWFDRTGRLLGPIGIRGSFLTFSLSLDGKRVAVDSQDPKSTTWDIHMIDLARGTGSKFTFHPNNDIWPIWSPDGSRILWISNRGGTYQLHQKPASGVGQDELLLKLVLNCVSIR